MNGGVLCIPTDTVYGLVCLPAANRAVERIRQIKGRRQDKPFALFVSSLERLRREPVRVSAFSQRLAERFWPGALTMVFPAEEGCPCASGGTVGARCPADSFIQSLLQGCGGLLVNTSLNRSGEGPVGSLDGMEPLLEQVDGVVDIGPLPSCPPSTVVDCTGPSPRILREGPITRQEIEEVWQKKNE